MTEPPAAGASTNDEPSESKAVCERLSSFSRRTWISGVYLFLATAVSVMIGVGLAAGGVLPNPGLGLAAAFGPLFAGWLASLALRSTVTAGDDGIHVRWLGWQRFFPYADIDVVARTQEHPSYELTIVLRSGRQFSLPGAAAAIDRVVARAQQAQARFDKRPAPELLASLQADSQPPRERLRKLRALGAGATAGPRTAAPDGEQLWRIIDSPSASDGDRAAAAVTLTSGQHDPATKKRLRVVAKRTANPKLRVVIDSLADDEPMEEEQLAEALGALERADRQCAD